MFSCWYINGFQAEAGETATCGEEHNAAFIFKKSPVLCYYTEPTPLTAMREYALKCLFRRAFYFPHMLNLYKRHIHQAFERKKKLLTQTEENTEVE